MNNLQMRNAGVVHRPGNLLAEGHHNGTLGLATTDLASCRRLGNQWTVAGLEPVRVALTDRVDVVCPQGVEKLFASQSPVLPCHAHR